MTKNEFRLFLEARNVEFNVLDDDAIIFIDFQDCREFTRLLGYNMLDEGGIEVRLKEGYIAMPIKDMCDDLGIDYLDVIPAQRPV